MKPEVVLSLTYRVGEAERRMTCELPHLRPRVLLAAFAEMLAAMEDEES